MNLQYIATLTSALLLFGCAATPNTNVSSPQKRTQITKSTVANPSIFTITNERAKHETKTETLSKGAHECHFGVNRLGDDDFAENRISLLENSLAEFVGPSANGKPLLIKRYEIFLNTAATYSASSWNLGMAAIGLTEDPTPDMRAKNITLKPQCSRERMDEGGWYDVKDLNTNASPMVVEMTVEYEGKTYIVNSSYSPSIEFFSPSMFGGYNVKKYSLGKGSAAFDKALTKAMEKANQRLVETIQSNEKN